MNRKNFLSSIVPLGLATNITALYKFRSVFDQNDSSIISPPFLKPGDTIGITCPAGSISLEEIQPAINKIKDWGYRVRIGDTIGKKDFTLAGTDQERLLDLQQMLDDSSVKAILFGRGGYGIVRIIDLLDLKKFTLHPKWIIGFSDITVLHSHINRNCKVASLHSKMCNSFPSDWSSADPVQIDTIEFIKQCIIGKKMMYTAPVNVKNKMGKATGQLVGGNLKTLESMSGTASDLVTKNKLLFVEDTGEYLYSIDRMFWNLQRTGKLNDLRGLIIGGFKVKPDDPGEEFGKTVEQIVLEKVKKYNYPVCFDFPVGHQKNNYPLKCGVVHHLVVSQSNVSLKEN
ncbi:MAG: LD-carboxypeptidase [Ferruginibacter sp.]